MIKNIICIYINLLKKNCLDILKWHNFVPIKMARLQDYIMPFYLVLCGANFSLKKWRKLPKYINLDVAQIT